MPRPLPDRWATAALHVGDIVVYVVVLNHAAWLVPSVIAESFVVSLLTAVLLKAVLEVVLVAKGRVMRRVRAATTWRGRLLSGLALWAVAVGSKFVVLELEDLLLGDAVTLGGFFSVTALIVTMLLARAAVRRAVEPSVRRRRAG